MKFIRQNTLFKNIAIVQNIAHHKNFANKDELVNFLHTENDNVYLDVKCICDKQFIYESINDIPAVNVTCGCGQKIIEYS